MSTKLAKHLKKIFLFCYCITCNKQKKYNPPLSNTVIVYIRTNFLFFEGDDEWLFFFVWFYFFNDAHIDILTL